MRSLRFNPILSNRLPSAAIALACVLFPASLSAAIIDKADNSNDLHLTTSRTGAVAPGANDVARSGGLAGANSVLLGGILAFQEITTASSQNRFATMTLIPEPSVTLMGGIGKLVIPRRHRY